MAMVAVFLFLSFSFLNQGIASQGTTINSCAELFRSSRKIYQKYDPNNMDQIINVLIREGEYKKIRNADPQKTNLPFFYDYVNDTIMRLQKEGESKNEGFIKEIESIISEARLKIKNKQVAYEWVWEFSYQALSIFESKYNGIVLRNLENILNRFPQEIMIPTFAKQDFKHFIGVEGYNVTFLGMRDEHQIVDGNSNLFSPEQFLNHDLLHYELSMKGDHLLTLKDKYYSAWMKLHSAIKSKIALLREPQRRYVQFIYFYLLHEEFGARDRLTYRFLDPRIGKMSEYVAVVLDQDLINSHYQRSHPAKVLRSELYTRATRPNDFRTAFPNATPEEVLLGGINGFVEIIKELESDPIFKPQAKKRFFLF